MSNLVKILVIDDEEVGRQLLEAILTPENYDVTFGENGEQGLKIANSVLPDIILCDVMMPGIDGFEVCHQIRENNNTSHIPIFLITALDDRDSRIRGIDAGADDYISKPFDRIEIVAKIKNSLNRLNSMKKMAVRTAAGIQENSDVNPSLMEGLIFSLSGNIENETEIELFRSARILESKHLFSRRFYHDKIFFFLISTTLESINAVLFNCTLMSFLHQNSLDNGQSLAEIIKKSITQYDKILTSSDLKYDLIGNTSIVAVRKNTKEGTIVCSGNNQTALINSEKNKSDSDAKTKFQPLQVSIKQDSSLEKSDQIFLLSSNIVNHVNQTEVCAFIDEEINQNDKKRVTSKIPEKFNITQDVLVVKLTF